MRNILFFSGSGRSLAIASLAGILALAACSAKVPDKTGTLAVATVTATNVADKVQQASTPADHQNLASYYEARAKAADRQVTEERDIRGRYDHRWGPGEHPMGHGVLLPYDHLIAGHEVDAREYRSLADWHREMAQQPPRPAGAE
jgi:hypothetical protein